MSDAAAQLSVEVERHEDAGAAGEDAVRFYPAGRAAGEGVGDGLPGLGQQPSAIDGRECGRAHIAPHQVPASKVPKTAAQ
jgi:hypothetical protein